VPKSAPGPSRRIPLLTWYLGECAQGLAVELCQPRTVNLSIEGHSVTKTPGHSVALRPRYSQGWLLSLRGRWAVALTSPKCANARECPTDMVKDDDGLLEIREAEIFTANR